jgi:hypothetical protein
LLICNVLINIFIVHFFCKLLFHFVKTKKCFSRYWQCSLGRIVNSKSASIVRNKKKTERKKERKKKRRRRKLQKKREKKERPRKPTCGCALPLSPRACSLSRRRLGYRRRPTPVTEVFVTPFTGGEHPPDIPFPSLRAVPNRAPKSVLY